MQPITILVAASLVVFFVWVIVRTQLADRRKGAAYYLRKSLFTPAERAFLAALERAIPDGVRVFGKVRLEDVFGVTRGLERGERLAARNQINRKHVDFLLVRDGDLAPLAGIELDDSSHEAEDRRQRDAFVDSVFASAGLPLLHMPAQQTYSLAELKARLTALLFNRQAVGSKP